MTEHARRHKRTADADERALRLHVLPLWRTRPFDRISRADVIALCERIVAKGSPIQANRVQALISKIFSFALDAELVAANPCARLKKRSKEVRITRVLTDDEIRLFWQQIGEPPNSARMGQALRLVLLTGVRVTELAGAEIKEFDRLEEVEAATWTIPASRSKNGRAHVIPLSKLAREIVRDLLSQAERRSGDDATRQFLLVSPVRAEKSIDGHALSVAMARFGAALDPESIGRRFTAEEGRAIKSWMALRPTAHDLRRTLATRLAGSGIPAEDVSACLNHVRKGVTATHYDHYDRVREKSRALTLWAQQVVSLVDRPSAANVVAIRAPG
jgi:integrase